MAKTAITLGLLAIGVFLSLMPLSVQAQAPMPQVLIGRAILDGQTPAEGTKITAWCDAEQLASTLTQEQGKFYLHVSTLGSCAIYFKVDDIPVADTVVVFNGGTIINNLELSVYRDPAFQIANEGYRFYRPTLLQGPRGSRGSQGMPGEDGEDGKAGRDGENASLLPGVIAVVISIVALMAAGTSLLLVFLKIRARDGQTQG